MAWGFAQFRHDASNGTVSVAKCKRAPEGEATSSGVFSGAL